MLLHVSLSVGIQLLIVETSIGLQPLCHILLFFMCQLSELFLLLLAGGCDEEDSCVSPSSPVGELLTRGSPGTSSAGAGAGAGAGAVAGAVAGAEVVAGEGAGSSVSDKFGRTTGLATFFFCPFAIVEYGSLLKTIKFFYIYQAEPIQLYLEPEKCKLIFSL